MGAVAVKEEPEEKPQPRKAQFVVRNPLFVARDSLIVVREAIAEAVNRHQPEYLFMPITADLEPFWELDVEKGWFNSSIAPYTSLFMAVRDYALEFTQLVDGRLVNYQRDYDRLLDAFNKTYVRALESKGSGWPKGTLSKDEFLRMTSLFYCLLMTADRTEGMVFDKMGHLCNGWNGESKIVSMNYKLASFYAERLAKCDFAGVEWQQFMFQAMSEHRMDRVSWVFNLTRFDVMEGSKDWNFDFQSFVQLLDMVRLLDPTYHQVTIVMQNDDKIRQFMREFCGMGLRFDDKTAGHKVSVATNYKFGGSK